MPTDAAIVSPKYSCVVDARADFRLQCYYWVLTLIELGGAEPGALYVHHVGALPPELGDWLRQSGIQLVEIEPFEARHPYCNKIQQLETFFDSDHPVVLMDCDTVVTRPVPWPPTGFIAASKVNSALPPPSMISRVWAKAGLVPRWTKSEFVPGPDGRQTVVNNMNGGIYFVAAGQCRSLEREWRRWTHFCLQNEKDFGPYPMHIDQVSFALALASMGLDAQVLPGEFNFPTHLVLPQERDCDPHILHYHREVDEAQLLRKTSLPKVDASIDRVNDFIRACRSKGFLNSVFWDYRYHARPDLGSGIGSRNASLSSKRDILKGLLKAGEYSSVLDVGCGDLEITRVLERDQYVGVDISREAIELARTKRPDWNFLQANVAHRDEPLPPSDLVICLDVLIHQPTEEAYFTSIENLHRSCRNTLVVGAYDCEPAFTSDFTFYYEPISRSLRRTGCFDEISVIGRYRDVSVLAAKKNRSGHHPRDMAPDLFSELSAWSRDPFIFRCLVDFSRRKVGFFPNHPPRAVEYPWIARRLESLPQGSMIVDAGAGVSCLPLWLASHGFRLTTIDSSTYQRKEQDRLVWNEWGYLDYGKFDPGICSRNERFEDTSLDIPVDACFSVSVMEHLPKAARSRWIEKFATLLRNKGTLLLTVDLVPNTDELWPYAEGRLVESSIEHGTLDMMLTELVQAGFTIEEEERFRNLPSTRVDIALVRAVRDKTATCN